MLAFYDMMKKTIVMPAHLMDDGAHVRSTTLTVTPHFASSSWQYLAADACCVDPACLLTRLSISV